jgi:hypothetical protein
METVNHNLGLGQLLSRCANEPLVHIAAHPFNGAFKTVWNGAQKLGYGFLLAVGQDG